MHTTMSPIPHSKTVQYRPAVMRASDVLVYAVTRSLDVALTVITSASFICLFQHDDGVDENY